LRVGAICIRAGIALPVPWNYEAFEQAILRSTLPIGARQGICQPVQ
jgi:hypothetical protein